MSIHVASPRRRAPSRPSAEGGWAGGLLLVAVLAYLVALPVGAIVAGALRSVPLDVPGPLTLVNLRDALAAMSVRGTVWATLRFAVGSTVLSVLIGGYLAWVTERTRARVRALVQVAVVVNLIVPGILTAISWSLLLHDRIGILNALTSRLIGASPFDTYTLGAMVWVDGVDGFALPYLLMAAALRSLDLSMEEAAAMSGATRLQRLRTITLPLLRPVVLTVAILTLLRAVGTFVVPVTLGLPGGVRVLATEVYLQSRVFPRDANAAAAYALVQLAVAVATLLAYRRATRSSDRFVTIGGRAGVGRPVPRNSSGAHAAISAVLVGVTVVLPGAVMVYASLTPFYRPPGSGTMPALSLQHYRWLVTSPLARRALLDNALVGGAAALAAVLLAMLVARRVVRRPGRLSGALDVLASAPIALPGTVLGLALLWWYLFLPLPVYGTSWVLVIALITTALPYGVRTLQASLVQVGQDLEEASTMCGAGATRTVWRIVVPLLLPTITGIALFLVARSFKQLALPSLLGVPGLDMVPTLILGLSLEARYPELSALGVVLSLGLAALTSIARAALRRRGVPR